MLGTSPTLATAPDPSSERSPTPSPDALDASVRLARLRQQMFARLEPPRIAQYHVLRQIGGGGMGLVFAAWDPSLDRVVAIKVLRDPWGPGSGDALRREALALARLRHPNVVSVFEVGEHDGQVYLAMEYVEGETLRTWLRSWAAAPKPDLQRLLEVFVEAARGLAAAHAAGLVHRDVKPENVMIDADGRVRLMDFGLARADGRTAPSPGHVDDGDATTASMASRGLVGTPAYMAPEQFDGLSPTAATDQFALCACLFEALLGRRARPDRMEAAAMQAAMPVVVPNDRRIPRRLHALLVRGLAQSPADRWPSMHVLADALGRLRRSGRDRRVLTAGLGVALAGVLVGVTLVARNDATCTGGEAQLSGVWDPERASAVSAHVEATGASFGAQAWAALVPELDAYRERWIDAHHGACAATHMRREVSEAQMDLRMACLDDRRRHLDALVDLVATGGAESLARAEEASLALPSIDACADARYVAHQGFHAAPSGDTAALDHDLAVAGTLLAARDPTTAHHVASRAVERATALGDAASLAKAELALGRAQASMQEAELAHTTLVRAYSGARSQHLTDVAAEAAVELVLLCAVDLSRFDEGAWWLRIAELDGAEIDDVHHTVRREQAAAALLEASGHARDAIAHAARARDLLHDAAGPSDRSFATALLELGHFHLLAGELEQGATLVHDGASTLERALGPQHPANARGQRMLAHAARLRGDVPTAIEHARAALALTEAAVGPRHLALAPYLESLANGLSQAGRYDEAIGVLDRAVALSEPRPPHAVLLARLHARRGETYAFVDPQQALAAYELAYDLSRAALGEHHRLTVRSMVAKGSLLGGLGRRDEADELLRVALLVGRTVLGAEHPDVAILHNALAQHYERTGDLRRSLEHHEAMLELLLRVQGPDAYALAGAHGNVCTMLLQLGRPTDAVPHCRRAVDIVDKAKGSAPLVAAELHNSFGGALLGADNPTEARAQLEVARAIWRDHLGPGSVEETTAINNLGEVAEYVGDCTTARALFHEVIAIRTAALGADHPSLVGPRANLERCTHATRER